MTSLVLFQLFTGFTKGAEKDTVFNNTVKPVLARFVKILPQTWVNGIAMRFGLYGCSSGEYLCVHSCVFPLSLVCWLYMFK